jgi:hypothetical protein
VRKGPMSRASLMKIGKVERLVRTSS